MALGIVKGASGVFEAFLARLDFVGRGQAGQGFHHVTAAREGGGQLTGCRLEPRLFVRQGGDEGFGIRKRTALERPARRGDVFRQFLAGAGQCLVHASTTGEGLHLACDRGHQIAAGGFCGVPFLGGFAFAFQPCQPLAHPEKACGAAVPFGLDEGRDEGFGVVGLMDEGAVAMDRGLCLAEPAFGQGVAGIVQFHLGRHAGRAADMRAQRVDLLGFRAMGLEEQGLQRVKQGGFAEFVRCAEHVQAGADAVDADRGDEAADVGEFDGDEFHARSSRR